tara:strand:+ start:2867 stop:3484 length:618 start_codon:yes stop_codon:yes gene_type:complete
MSFIIFTKIFFACLIGAMSPGPSMAIVVSNAIFKNRYHGILTSIGHGTGISIYAIFAVIGIGLIIKTNIIIFNCIKIISVIFLFYMGIKSILNKTKINFEQGKLTGGATSFFQGLSISILNPKIFIWFVAIYSQFMSEDNNTIFNVCLIITAGVVDTMWYISLTILATTSKSLNFIKSKSDLLSKIIGYLLLILGVVITVDIFIQ